MVLAQAPVTVATLVPNDLTPRFRHIGRSTGGSDYTFSNKMRSLGRIFFGSACSSNTSITITVRRANLASLSEGFTVGSHSGITINRIAGGGGEGGGGAAHSDGC